MGGGSNVVFRIEQRGARHAGVVDATVLIEVLVFGGEEAVDDKLRHRLDRQVQPAFLGVFGEQRTVGGVNARHHRRLIILKLRIVRQVLGIMPDHAGDGSDADQNTTVPAANRKPKNRTSKRIIDCPFSTLAPRNAAFVGVRPLLRDYCLPAGSACQSHYTVKAEF